MFHVTNRGVRRSQLFDGSADYHAFQRLLAEARHRVPVRLLAYCLMPNHFHLVTQPVADDDLPEFMRWLTGTHAKRFHAARGSTGLGAVYQGRYKAFPVQTDAHFLRVCRYVERNPLRAGLVSHAELWAWSSLGQDRGNCHVVQMDEWPISKPFNWTVHVNQIQTAEEIAAIQSSVMRNRPFGDTIWCDAAASTLGLEPSLRSPGRPHRG